MKLAVNRVAKTRHKKPIFERRESGIFVVSAT
jgi:hypothetical protein